MSDEQMRDALKMIPYGFYAVSTKSDAEANIMVANWITQVSFEPRLLAFGLQKTSYSRSVIEDGRVFTVNLFKAEDEESIMPFTKGRSKNPDKMKGARYTPAPVTGCPVLEDAVAYIELEVDRIIDLGSDHDVVIGKVVGADVVEAIDASDVLTLPAIGWSYAG